MDINTEVKSELLLGIPETLEDSGGYWTQAGIDGHSMSLGLNALT